MYHLAVMISQRSQLRMGRQNLCENAAVKASPPSMEQPSFAIQSNVAASEVMAAFPTPIPSKIF